MGRLKGIGHRRQCLRVPARGLVCLLLLLLLFGPCATTAQASMLRLMDNQTFTVCFAVSSPHLFLNVKYSQRTLDELHLRDLSMEQFNEYFDGHEVELATATLM